MLVSLVLINGCEWTGEPSEFLFDAEDFLLADEKTFLRLLSEKFVVTGQRGYKPVFFTSWDNQTYRLRGQNIFIGYQLASEAELPHHSLSPRQTRWEKLNKILEENEKTVFKDGEQSPDKSVEDIVKEHTIDVVCAIELFLPYKVSKPRVVGMLGYPLEKIRKRYSDEGIWRHPKFGRIIMVSHTPEGNTHILVSVVSHAKK